MADITSTGVAPLDLTGYKNFMEAEFAAEFGDDFSLDAETPQAMIIGISALVHARQDERLVALASSISPGTAEGRWLEYLYALLNVKRRGAVKTTVTATCSGDALTVIRTGSRARTTDGDEFVSIEDGVIGSTGTVDIRFEAVEFGPVAAATGTLTQIATPLSGWDSVTNAAAGVLGRLRETDRDYRTRYQFQTSKWAQGSRQALAAAILEAGATRVRVVDNKTASATTVQGLSIAANAYMCIVKDGTDANIAAAIDARGPLGVPTAGAESETVDGKTVNFQRVAETAAKMTVTIIPNNDFPTNGLPTIRANILQYALDNWSIGGAIDPIRFYEPIYRVGGHRVSVAPAATLQNGNSLPGDTNLNVLYTLDSDDLTVTVTT